MRSVSLLFTILFIVLVDSAPAPKPNDVDDGNFFRSLSTTELQTLMDMAIQTALRKSRVNADQGVDMTKYLPDGIARKVMGKTDPEFFRKLVDWITAEWKRTASAQDKQSLIKRLQTLKHDDNIYCCPFGK